MTGDESWVMRAPDLRYAHDPSLMILKRARRPI
jgi:hypothetical protein